MDIMSYIKIKSIIHVDDSATEYIRGIVCRKNVAHKRMRTDINKPKIMLLLNAFEMDNSDILPKF